ncbi:MAG: TetR/AcrR family transcriptional regulator [Bacilli bacterium]|jgi:AcrR family transcriptional regulator|nr:TetR/AcrR family transcriptional regulator [Bacilli bacterium]
MKKQLEIINTARDLFTTYGYKKVSMDEIAKTAGVTKRTIYHYFKDKDTLFQYFVDEERAKIKEAIEEIEKANLPFFETVHETLLTILRYRKQSKLLNTIQREADLFMSETALQLLKKVEQEMEQYIASRLQKAIDEEQMKPCNVELCSFLLVKLYIALMLEWDIDKKPLALEEITDNITQILKTGIFYS